MKRLVIFSLIAAPMFVFSQREIKNEINWLPLETAELLSKDSGKNMLFFFYRDNCDFCDKMKKETFSDPSVIKLINNNFFPVMINGKSKNPITYNKKEYTNDKPNIEDDAYFHDLFKELVEMKDGNYYWPTIVIINGSHQKIIQGQGFWPKELTLRNLKLII